MPCGDLASFKGKLANLSTVSGLDPKHAGGFILVTHLAGFQATMADLVSHWWEVGKFSSTLAGFKQKLVWGFIHAKQSKINGNGKKGVL